MRKSIFAALAAVVVVAAPAMAQKAPEGRPTAPQQAQRAQDHAGHRGPDGMRGPGSDGRGPEGRRGRPSPDRMFAMMDANGDGKIDRKEFDRFHDGMREHRRDGMGRGGTGHRGAGLHDRHEGRATDCGWGGPRVPAAPYVRK
jgi:hypothetical protein